MEEDKKEVLLQLDQMEADMAQSTPPLDGESECKYGPNEEPSGESECQNGPNAELDGDFHSEANYPDKGNDQL